MPTVSVYFDACREFDPRNISPLSGVCGLYFIALKRTQIPYPFGKSRLIYIGMSEKKTNSIGKRLAGHYDGSSGNEGLVNYRKAEGLIFTYINFEMLKRTWQHRIEDLESYFILDFLRRYGVYPICNNKSGFEVRKLDVPTGLAIDWPYFEKEQQQDV
jgi:hypothetical protein